MASCFSPQINLLSSVLLDFASWLKLALCKAYLVLKGGGTETDVVFVGVLGFHGSLVNYVGCGALSWQWAFLFFPAIAGVWFFVGVTINYFAVVCFYPLIYLYNSYTKILEVNLFAFAYRLFRRDFPIGNSL